MTAAKRFARAVGAVYLLVVVLAGIVQVSVHAGINVPGTANAGAQDSGASSALPPVSLQADVATAMAFLLVGATLYLLFRRVDRRASGAPVVFAAVGSGLILVNLLFHHAALLVEPDPSYRSLGAQPYGGLMSLLLDMHDRGYTLAGIVLGLSLLPLGCLAYQSSMMTSPCEHLDERGPPRSPVRWPPTGAVLSGRAQELQVTGGPSRSSPPPLLPRVIGSLLVVGLVVSTLVGFVRPDLPAIIPKPSLHLPSRTFG